MKMKNKELSVMPRARLLARAAVRTLLVAFATFALATTLVAQASAQTRNLARPYPANPGLTPLHHPSLPTGELATFQNVAGKPRVAQPVQWKLPQGVVASVAQEGEFVPAPNGDQVFGLTVGQVYRFKLDGIALFPGQTLYPTLELIGRLNPPEGKLWDFPIEIEASQRDLALALRGALVTRVIFVENPENALNVDASESNENLTFDVPDFIDPIVAARTRGRALAILRLGTREPGAAPNAADPFFFGLPPVEFQPQLSAQDESAQEESAAEESAAEIEDDLSKGGSDAENE